MSLLRHPRLPEGEATHVLASGEFPWLAEALERRGLTVVATQRDSRLPGPVQFHPDLQTCPLPDKQMFVLKNSPLQPALKALGFSLRETQCEPSGTYPGDALCGCFPWGPWLVGNPKAIDRAIAQEAQKQGFQPLPVRQGYSACSVALVDGESAITADQGMFQALRTKGFAVLLMWQVGAGQAGLCGSAVQPSRWRADAGVFAQPLRGACRAAGKPLSGCGRYPSIAGALREGRRWPERETEKKKHKIIENKYFL